MLSPKAWRMTKAARIYTRTGDDGTTGLIGGQRVRKDALRIEAYGTIDELSAAIGTARAALESLTTKDLFAQPHARELSVEMDMWLSWTQDVLFNLGCELATPLERRSDTMPRVSSQDTAALERAIDKTQASLPELTAFIHPGGSYPGAFLHLARTIARRAERLLVSLNAEEELSEEGLRYVNRLSDALFVWSRRINHALGRPEPLWNAKACAPDKLEQ